MNIRLIFDGLVLLVLLAAMQCKHGKMRHMMCFLMFMLPFYKCCHCCPPLTPHLVRSGGGPEPTTVTVDGCASLANRSSGDGGHHHWLRWLWQKKPAKETTSLTMVLKFMVAGAMHCRWRTWLASSREKEEGRGQQQQCISSSNRAIRKKT